MKTIKSALPLFLSALALAIAIATVPLDASGRPKLGVSNFDSIHLRDTNATAVPNFVADQRGSGVIAEFRDGGTPVARFPNGGGFNLLSGTFANSGDLTVTGALTVTGTSDQTGAATFNGAVDIDGNLTSGTSAITAADNVVIDGAADAVQLTVQGWTTQTTNLVVFEQSDGTDVLTVTNAGALEAASTITFGSDDNFPLGYASSAQEMACVSTTITGTAAVAVTGVTTPTFGIATLVTDPGTGAGDPFLVTIDAPTTTTLQVNVLQDDASAGTSGAIVHVCAIGDE